MVLERLNPAGEGIIADENHELQIRYPSYRSNFLFRISFWRSIMNSETDLRRERSYNLIGYAIVKNDTIPDKKINQPHVFEAVFEKYAHRHNCIRKPPVFKVHIGEKIFSVKGFIFAQQNSLSKCCAHVALYSLIAGNNPLLEPSFAQMTKIVNGLNKNSLALEPKEIRKILDFYGLKYHDYYYTNKERNSLISGEISEKTIVPFNKLLYAGIESGAGALAGFILPGGDGHIIPFYGHTFNKDTWVPDAEIAYFKTGQIKYSPSENWTSSFIGHDDNFGANLCIPKLYLTHKNVNYVIEIFKKGIVFSGVSAEILAYRLFFSIIKSVELLNVWYQKTLSAFCSGRIVLRTVALNRAEYIRHLSHMEDWEKHQENNKIVDLLKKYLPSHIWLTEFSLPQLFPANERKVGEIIIDGTQLPSDLEPYKIFSAARFPGRWYFPGSTDEPSFFHLESSLLSHTPNFS